MFVRRTLLCFACAAASLAHAESVGPRRGYLGLQLGHSGVELTCGKPAFACERAWASTPMPGSHLSFVGLAPIGESFRLEGRIGTRFGPAETAAMGAAPAADRSLGLSVGAALRWDFSRRGSAALGLHSYEQPLAGGGRETVRSATVGLQWRY
jgi:hypothetical protein